MDARLFRSPSLFLGCVLITTLAATACTDSGSPGTTDDADPSGADTDDEDDDTPASKDAGARPGKVDAGKIDAGAVSTGKSDAQTSDEDKPDATAAAPSDAGKPVVDAGKTDAAVDAGSAGNGELCHLKWYQVGVMGDSYIDLSGDFTKFVQENARKAGALGANENYIDLAKSGAAMQKGNLLAPAIPTQLPTLLSTSKRSGPEGVKLVLMTGGGNDVLIDAPQCKTLEMETEECKTVVSKSLAVIKKLFTDMKAGGIKEVVYFWYPDLGKDGGEVINDYSVPLAKEQCESNTDVRCHFVDTRDGFRNHPEYVAFDGIHPTAAGSTVIANLVWDVMVDNCLASK